MELSPRALRSMLNMIPSGITLDVTPCGTGGVTLSVNNDGKILRTIVIAYGKNYQLRDTIKNILPEG